MDTDDHDLDKELELLLQEEAGTPVVNMPVQVNRLTVVQPEPVAMTASKPEVVVVKQEEEPEAALV